MVSVIMEIIIRVLSKERDHTKMLVEAIIDSEIHYLFTNDKDYKESRQEIVQPSRGPMGDPQMEGQNNQGPNGQGGPPNQPPQRPPPQKESGTAGFVREMRTRIDQYFTIILRSIKDQIPKTIGYFLVRKSEEIL